MSWVDAHRDTRVVEVAPHFVDVQKGRSCPCLACGAEKRHTKSGDKRGAVGIRRDGRGWRCFQCDASGDALDFVAYALAGCRLRDADADGRAKVREWFEGQYGATSAPPAPRPAPAPAAPNYPPPAEVRRLFSSRVGVTSNASASGLLRQRKLVPRVVEELGLAFALPEDDRSELLPAGYELAFPLYDDHGEIRSALARRTGPGDGPKSRSPRGYERRGLVMADALGLYLLKTGARPSWWADDAPPLRVVICEGEIDFLTAACEASDANEHAPAVLGIFNGSWTRELAARIPDGCHVIIATDNDADGDRYAAQIVESFEGRDVTLLRWRAIA